MANPDDIPKPIKGQLDIYDCLEIIGKGLDGQQRRPKGAPMSVADVVRRKLEEDDGMEHRGRNDSA